MSKPRLLVIDIETSPSHSYHWGLFKQNISLPQLIEPGRVICWAAKWHGEKKIEFKSEFHDSHHEVIHRAHQLLCEAQAVIHYNGQSFDVPHLNRMFALAQLPPPSPFLQIDLLRTVRKQFRFLSNKLDHVTEQFGLSGKMHTTSFETWVKCLEGDEQAWSVMRKYNKQDVVTTDELYQRILPWISNHPHIGLLTEQTLEDCCNKCGSTDLIREGYAHTSVSTFAQYRCRKCGGWSRGKKAVARVDARGVAA
jgi:DNA polymerase elongation subunit (family B)